MLLTTSEKERIFMDSIQSFYYNQRQVLDDEDFDKLKEDLAWEGSKVRSKINGRDTANCNTYFSLPRHLFCVTILHPLAAQETKGWFCKNVYYHVLDFYTKICFIKLNILGNIYMER